LEFLWDRAWEGEWDGPGAMVKQALKNEQIHNPERRLQNIKECV